MSETGNPWNMVSIQRAKKKTKKKRCNFLVELHIHLRLVGCDSRRKGDFIWSILLGICTLGHCKLN